MSSTEEEIDTQLPFIEKVREWQRKSPVELNETIIELEIEGKQSEARELRAVQRYIAYGQLHMKPICVSNRPLRTGLSPFETRYPFGSSAVKPSQQQCMTDATNRAQQEYTDFAQYSPEIQQLLRKRRENQMRQRQQLLRATADEDMNTEFEQWRDYYKERAVLRSEHELNARTTPITSVLSEDFDTNNHPLYERNIGEQRGDRYNDMVWANESNSNFDDTRMGKAVARARERRRAQDYLRARIGQYKTRTECSVQNQFDVQTKVSEANAELSSVASSNQTQKIGDWFASRRDVYGGEEYDAHNEESVSECAPELKNQFERYTQSPHNYQFVSDNCDDNESSRRGIYTRYGRVWRTKPSTSDIQRSVDNTSE